MFNFILFGPPGSGKGTQSTNIINTYGLYHISTGDLLRDEVSRQTDLGIKAKQIIDAGQLVSDEIVIQMISGKLDENPNAKGFVFDGFPRTTGQAEALDQLLEERGSPIKTVISLEVPEEELKRRLLERGKVSGRTDDNMEVIESRVEEYRKKTEPVAAYYEAKGKLARIKGDGSIQDTFALIQNEIEKFVPVS